MEIKFTFVFLMNRSENRFKLVRNIKTGFRKPVECKNWFLKLVRNSKPISKTGLDFKPVRKNRFSFKTGFRRESKPVVHKTFPWHQRPINLMVRSTER